MKNLLIIPAYNEEEALPRTIASLQTLPDGYEIVVINDGSKDRTSEVALIAAETSRLPLRVVDLPLNGGIGVAMQTGYRFAAQNGPYEYVLQFDADGQHDAACIEALVAECRAKGLDLCIGSRFIGAVHPSPLRGEGQGGEGSPANGARENSFRSTFTRRIGIRFFAALITFLSGAKVTDPTSGFRCAGPRAWRHFAERYPEDYPEPESLFWCAHNKLKIGEAPVRMRERQGGVSSIRALNTVYYMIKVSMAIVIDKLRVQEHRES